jgi:hypothetical protein
MPMALRFAPIPGNWSKSEQIYKPMALQKLFLSGPCFWTAQKVVFFELWTVHNSSSPKTEGNSNSCFETLFSVTLGGGMGNGDSGMGMVVAVVVVVW